MARGAGANAVGGYRCRAQVLEGLTHLGLSMLGADPSQRDLKEILLVMELLGRAACPAPMLNVALTNLALAQRAADSPQVAAVLECIRKAEAVPCVAWGHFDGDSLAGRCLLTGERLNGKLALLDGMQIATHLVVMLGGTAGVAIAELTARGVEIRETPGLGMPPLCEVTLRNVPVRYFAAMDSELADLAWIARLGLLARAAGAARRSFELAVDYAKVRKQFGQLIGRFQAIQHKLADCLISIEASELLLANAVEAWERRDTAWRLHCASAFAFAGPALRQVSLEVHHTFGAIGDRRRRGAPPFPTRASLISARLGRAPRRRTDRRHAIALPVGGTPNRTSDWPPTFRQEVRNWLAIHWDTDAQNRERAQPFEQRDFDRAFSQKLARQGWIAVSWPQEYGGQSRSPLEQFVFVEEMSYARGRTAAHTCGSELVGPALIAFGTLEQKENFLPAILRGERHSFVSATASRRLAPILRDFAPAPCATVIDG